MRTEEEEIIKDLYRKQLSFTQISKHLDKRSSNWVQSQYLQLLRSELRIIKQHLNCGVKVTNDDICTWVKNDNISDANFEKLSQEDKRNVSKSLEFIYNDRNGQK